MANIGSLVANLALESAAFHRDLGKAAQAIRTNTAQMARQMREVATATRSLEKQMASFHRAATGLGATLAGLGLGLFLKDVVRTSAEFQKLQASLRTVTGGAENASRAFAMIKNFAATTPFDLQEVTRGFVKLKALGLDPSEKALRSYGNTASAMGKSLNDFIEAVADAATGEFERLKEFGIKASSEGSKVSFTFQGVTTTVRKNASEIEDYLRRIGEVQFAGAMEEQAKTLGGALSNLGDAFSVFQNEIGEGGFASAVADIARNLADAANGSNNLARQIGSALADGLRAAAAAGRLVVDNFREIGAAIAGLIAFKASTVFLSMAAAVVTYAKAIHEASLVTGVLNAVLAKNPFIAAATAIAGLVSAAILFRNETLKIGDTTVRVGNVLTAVWTTVRESVVGLVQSIGNLAGALQNVLVLNFTAASEKWAASNEAIRSSYDKIVEAWSNLAPAVEESTQEITATAEASTKAATATAELAKKAKDAIKSLEQEVAALENERLALSLVGKARDEVRLAQEVLNEQIKAGIELTESATEADRKAAEAIAFNVRERAKLRKEIEATKDLQAEQKKVAIEAGKAQAAAISDPQLRRQAELAIDRQERINELVEEYGTVAEGTGKKLLEMWDQQALSQEQVRFWNEVRQQAEEVSKNISDFLVDGFVNAEKGGKSAFENIWEGAKAGAKRFIAELASLFIRQKLILPIVTSVIGGAPGLFNIASAAGGGGSGAGGMGGLLGGGAGAGGSGFGVGLGDIASLGSTLLSSGSLFGGTLGGFGAVNQFGAQIGFGVPGLSGSLTSATLSSVLGVAGIGALAGGLLAEPLGLNPVGSSIGAGLGAGVGFMVGGPVGALIGGGVGLLGGLFGGGKSVGPNGGASFRVDPAGFGRNPQGLAMFEGSGGDNGFDPSSIVSTVNGLTADINELLRRIGGTSFGRSRIFNLQNFPSQGGILAGVRGQERSFGDDAEAAVASLVIQAFKQGDPQGISAQVAAAIRNSAATTLEGFVSDIEFAQSLAGITTQLSAFDQALAEVDKRFAEMTDRAKALGLSIDDVNAAREREIQAVTMQARAPYIQAAESIAGFLQQRKFATLSPAEQFSEAQKQFGSLVERVRGGEVGLTGNLLQTADALLGLGRQNFASGVSFANLDRNVTSTLASLGELLTDKEYFDAQVEATRQQTEVQHDDAEEIKAALQDLRREFQMFRQEAKAA